MKYSVEDVIKTRSIEPETYLEESYDITEKVEFDRIYSDFIKMLEPDEQDKPDNDEEMGFDVDCIYLHPDTFKKLTREAKVYTKENERSRFKTLWAVYGPNISKDVPKGMIHCLEGYYRET